METDLPIEEAGKMRIYIPSSEMREGNIVQVWAERMMEGI
jgi:hypothetical protein